MNSNLQCASVLQLKNGISLYNDRKYIPAIKSFFPLIENSIVATYFVISSYAKLGCVYKIFETVNSYLEKSSSGIFSSDPRPQPETISIFVKSLEYVCCEVLYQPFDVVEKLKKLESFFIKDFPVLLFYNRFTEDQIRLLANSVNVLGDQYFYCCKYKCAHACYEYANIIYPNSVYSRINYARLASIIGYSDLALNNLSKANDLLFHSGRSKGIVHDPHGNRLVSIDDTVFQQFVFMSRNLGFEFG